MTFRLAVAIITMISWVTFLSSFLMTSIWPVYEPAEDPGKREWYPAVLVESTKHFYAQNSIDYSFKLRLDDGSLTNVIVSEETYNKHNIGDTVSFERHITDPKARNWSCKVNSTRWISFLIFVIFFLIFVNTKSEHESE